MMPLVSVIIPTYNRTTYIGEAIDSVLAQTYENYEIIVIDDGSSVDVKKVLKPYEDKIKYLYQENRGLAAARNTGIKNSSGDYLAFLDDDDLFEPRKLEIQVKILESNPDVGFVYSDCLEFDTNKRTKLELNLAVCRNRPAGEFANLFFINPSVRVPALLVRRKCFEDAGLFDETLAMHEDGDMLLRIALHWRTRYSDYPSARVRYHEANMSKDDIVMYKSILKSSRKILSSYPEFNKSLAETAERQIKQIEHNLFKALAIDGHWDEAKEYAQNMVEKLFVMLRFNLFYKLRHRLGLIAYSYIRRYRFLKYSGLIL